MPAILDTTSIILLATLFAVCFVGATCALRPLRRTGKFAPQKSDFIQEPENNSNPVAEDAVSDDCYVLEEEQQRIAESSRQHTQPRKTVHSIDPALLPSLSVIVYALCNEERLEAYLSRLFLQDYPEFEVVVVFDGGSDTASDMADIFMSRYPNLRLTFVPPNSHNLSRRKLAWTLGMKRASNQVVLTTAANSEIPSRDWLYNMMAPFANPEIDLVLGVTRFDFREFSGPSRWFKQFDRVIANSAWISRAAAGKPYRGDCYNMAFKRHLFFKYNGYAASIGKPFGDDDIFVSEIATQSNTKVVLSPSSLLTMDWGISTEKVRISLKEQQMFAQKHLSAAPAVRQGLLSSCFWISLILTIVTIITSLTASHGQVPWAAIAALIPLLALWGLAIAAYRKAAKALNAVRLWWSVPLFILARPISNSIFRFRHRKAKVMDFIWNGYQ